MLKNIKLLEKLKPIVPLQDNEKFPQQFKNLKPFFDYNFFTAEQLEHETYFYNLLWLAQQDLSLAHCVQHTQTGQFMLESAGVEYDKNNYNNQIFGFSDNRAMDTIKYDTANKCLTAGVKGWLSNLKSGNIMIIRVVDTDNVDVYDVLIDLRSVKHNKIIGTQTSLGMKGAEPGILELPEAVPVGTEHCFVVQHNPRKNVNNYLVLAYVKHCWATVHLGVVLGLWNDLLSYSESKDPSIQHLMKTMELKISNLKINWEHGLETIYPNSPTKLSNNEVLSSSTHQDILITQYANSKQVLLDLINLILELGFHGFVDESTASGYRFKDALTYVTHMFSLYRCHNIYQKYNILQ